MKQNNEVFDKVLDALIDEAAEKVLADEAAEAKVYDVEFSPEHNAKMKKLFRQARRSERPGRKLHPAVKAAVLIVGVIIMSLAVKNAEALKIKFFNFIFDSNAPDTVIEFSDTKQDKLHEDVVELAYIPEGFALTKNKVSDRTTFLKFKCNNKYFQLKINKLDANSAVNTYEGDVENITVNNYEGFYIVNKNENMLIWHDSIYTYRINANIEKDEMIKIAENIKMK